MKLLWTELAKQGWHIDWRTPKKIVEVCTQTPAQIDDFMIGHLKQSWEFLTHKVLELHPLRKRILDCAFKHIQNEDWISAIPLLFSQIDGVALETFGVSIFYRRDVLERKIKKKFPDAPEHDAFVAIILDIMIVDTPFARHAANSRHGVLHGRADSLEYGTIENAYKAFSLLCFTVDCCNRVKKA